MPDITNNNIISGKNIYLRPIEPSDTSMIVKWRNSVHVRRFFLHRSEISCHDHEKWMSEMVESGRVIQWIIHEQKTDAAIGSVYLRDIDCQNRKCEFGIFIGEENFLGHGYGKEACILATDYAFAKLHLSKVYLRLVACNKVALNVYKHCRYEVEGIFRMDRWIDDAPVDVIYMARYNKDNNESKIPPCLDNDCNLQFGSNPAQAPRSHHTSKLSS